jgi:hypothetical protein
VSRLFCGLKNLGRLHPQLPPAGREGCKASLQCIQLSQVRFELLWPLNLSAPRRGNRFLQLDKPLLRSEDSDRGFGVRRNLSSTQRSLTISLCDRYRPFHAFCTLILAAHALLSRFCRKRLRGRLGVLRRRSCGCS